MEQPSAGELVEQLAAGEQVERLAAGEQVEQLAAGKQFSWGGEGTLIMGGYAAMDGGLRKEG